MNWGNAMLIAMAVQCAIASVCYFRSGNVAFGVAFIGYTIANGGLLLAARGLQ